VNTLADKCILITGAAKRVGASIARAAHLEGANVAIHYRSSRTQAEALCNELNALRAKSAIAIQADLLDTQSHPRLIQETLNEFGRLDVLVNNASTFYPTPLGTITEAQWQDLMGSNLKAPFFLSQAAMPALKATRGLILNLADIHARRPLLKHPVYSIAKAGLLMLTQTLARELGPEIRVNGISPGPVMWPADIDQALQDEIISKTALKRSGTPDDVARTAVFFMKDAPFVTGQILAVDGGRSIGW
jgi:pteridine reductase